MSKKIIVVLAGFLCLSSLAFVACGKQGGKSGVPTVKWYNFAPYSGNWKADIDKISDYTEEKYGVRFTLYDCNDQTLQTMITAGEDWDISFVNNILYNRYAPDGVFWDITASIPQELKDVIPQVLWDGTKVKGNNYAVPTYKDSSITNYVVWDAKYADKYKVDTSKTSLADLDTIFRQIKAGEGARYYPAATSKEGLGALILHTNYDGFGLGMRVLGVGIHDKTGKVVNILEQPDVVAGFRTFHQWYTDGIINPDAPILDGTPQPYLFGVLQGWPSAWATGANGVDKVVTYQLGETVYSTDSIMGSMNVINNNSKNKEAALKFLTAVNTDRHLRDMLGWGIEGRDWEYASPTTIKKLSDRWTGWVSYRQGQFFNKSTEVGSYTWDEVLRQNERAISSPLLGFVPETSGILNELTQCAAIQEKYWNDLSNGSSDPATVIPKFLAELKAAGIDKITAEVQGQINTFLKK
jgi:putative aldouronate transport system substrate-binding protein